MLATRGDRLALCRLRVEGADRRRRAERDRVPRWSSRWTTHGELVAAVRFDPDDLDAAYAELDARYAAGEAARIRARGRRSQRMRRLAAATGTQSAALFAPDLVVRRPPPARLGHALRRRDEVLAQHGARRARARRHGCAPTTSSPSEPGRLLGDAMHRARRDGGAFEIRRSSSFGARRPRARIGRFDPTTSTSSTRRARASTELTAEPPAPRIENAATRAADRFGAAWEARDWERIGGALRARVPAIDRREAACSSSSIAISISSRLRTIFEMRVVSPRAEVLATRGRSARARAG